MLQGVDVASFQASPGSWARPVGDIVWAAVKLTELEPNGTKYVNPDAKADMDWLNRTTRPASGTCLALLDTDAVALDLETTDGLPAQQVAAATPGSSRSWPLALDLVVLCR